MDDAEIQGHRCHHRRIVQCPGQGHGLLAVHKQVCVGVERAVLGRRHVKIRTEVAHALFAVQEVCQGQRTIAYQASVETVQTQVCTDIALHRRSKGIERDPILNMDVLQLDYQVLLLAGVMVVVGTRRMLGVDIERALSARQVQVGVHMLGRDIV